MDTTTRRTLTTADLPEGLTLAEARTPKPLTVHVLTCEHGPACPSCVLAAARVLIDEDASLAPMMKPLYTG